MITKSENFFLSITYYSAIVIALFCFTAFSLTAIHHILLLISGIFFLIVAIKKREFNLSKSSWSLFFLIIASIISVVVNDVERPFSNILKLKYFLIPLLGIFAYRAWFKKSFSEKKVKLVVNLFLISVMVANISGLIGLYTGFNPLRFKESCHLSRNCGMYGMFMTFGYGMMFVMIILTGLMLYREKIRKYLNLKILYVSFLVCLVGFILSYARGALIGFFIALPFFFFKNNKKRFLLAFIVIIISSLLAFKFIPQINSLFTSDARTMSVTRRITQYQAAVKIFMEKPILGIGYKNFEPNSIKYKKKYDIEYHWIGGHAHSNFFEHLASTGIIGLILLIMFHFLWGYEMCVRDDIFARICFPFVIALFISGQFQYTLGDGENLFLIMFIYVLSQVKINYGN
jgi:O-antigen ligase